jgi:hypothetical protein
MAERNLSSSVDAGVADAAGVSSAGVDARRSMTSRGALDVEEVDRTALVPAGVTVEEATGAAEALPPRGDEGARDVCNETMGFHPW